MNILVVGSGGREHALIWKLQQSSQVRQLYCAPGNGGIGEMAELVPITYAQQLQRFAKEAAIDLTVIGPEAPLIAGIVDQFVEAGLQVFGPHSQAAIIEGSKSWAKNLMTKYQIPTAGYQVCRDLRTVKEALATHPIPVVIKADGLAAGKGVTVCHSHTQALQVATELLAPPHNSPIVVEDYLEGEELSLMAFVDGTTVIPMVPAQDHKPVCDHDEGPNTGGMGAYSPVPQIDKAVIAQAIREILQPTAEAMVKEGRPFSGVLYAGLMITSSGPKVIEFNARFGDPETQVVLPRLKTDLADILWATAVHQLDTVTVSWSEQAAVSVVLAAPGYPGEYPTGLTISGCEQVPSHVHVFHAGTDLVQGQFVSTGGRVLAITALAPSVKTARDRAYSCIGTVSFPNMHYRSDIAAKALIPR